LIERAELQAEALDDGSPPSATHLAGLLREVAEALREAEVDAEDDRAAVVDLTGRLRTLLRGRATVVEAEVLSTLDGTPPPLSDVTDDPPTLSQPTDSHGS
jgi:hypothetical protein